MSVYVLDTNDRIACCPYCNEKPQRLQGVQKHKYWVWCNNSNCKVQPSTAHYRVKGLDVLAWNKELFV